MLVILEVGFSSIVGWLWKHAIMCLEGEILCSFCWLCGSVVYFVVWEAMGGCCSKKRVDKSNLYAAGRGGNYGSGVAYQPTQVSLNSGGMSPQVRENMEKELPESEDVSEPKKSREPSPNHQKGMPGYANNMDDFYDGIPRYTRARSLKSRSLRSQGAVAKVGASEADILLYWMEYLSWKEWKNQLWVGSCKRMHLCS